MADHEGVQQSRFYGAPYDDDVDADGEQGGGCLDLEALEQEAVAQGRLGIVQRRARAQEERWEGDGEDLDVCKGGDGKGGNVAVGGKKVRVRRTGQDGEGTDINP